MGFSKQDSVALSSESSIAYSGGITNTNSTLFDGSNDYMVCGNSATLNPADITIVAWIKPGGLTNWDYLFTRGTDHYDRAYRFEVGGSNLFCAFGDGAGRNNVSITAAHGMSNGNWYHVAVTFDGSNAALYVDGASIGTASISIVMDTSAQITYVCFPVASNPHFSGHVDEVAIFSSALSAGDINAIYGGGLPGDLSPYSPAAWWRMGDSNDGAGILIYDEVDKTLGDELIVNGDMEIDANWNDISTPTTNERSTTRVNSGTYSRKCVTDSGADGLKSDTIAVVAGKTYQVTCSFYMDSGGASGGLLLRMQDGNGADVDDSHHQDASLAGSWQTVTFYTTVTTTDSSSYFKIYQNGAGAITFYLDDVSVKLVNGNPGRLKNSPVIGIDIPAAS